jgi:hypothetical protein
MGKERRDRYDYSSAEKYGKLIFIFEDGQVRMDATNLQAQLRDRLKDFTDDDYIICGGDPAVLFAAGIALYTNDSKWSAIKLLRWDKFKSDYRVYKLERQLTDKLG